MSIVGIRDMKTHLSRYIRRVKKGEAILISDHGDEVAMLVPAPCRPGDAAYWRLVQEGKMLWAGGTPLGSRRPLHLKGKPFSQRLLEDRQDRF